MRPNRSHSQLNSLLFALILASGAPLIAQGGATRDPLSGTWSGYIGRSEAHPTPVKVELKLAPDRTVSGTVSGPELTPGDITAGTFNPSTGTIEFTVVVRSTGSEAGGRVAFAGRVARDTASGTIKLGGETGVFKLMKGAAAAPGGPPAPATSPAASPMGDANAALRRGFIEVSDWLTRAAELVPADRYSYRPVSTVRTFGQLVGHVVDGSRYYCGRGAGQNVEWSDATEKGVTTKPALVQALKKALADCAAVYERAGQFGPLLGNVGHASLHYGNMVTYMRMLGLTPPSS